MRKKIKIIRFETELHLEFKFKERITEKVMVTSEELKKYDVDFCFFLQLSRMGRDPDKKGQLYIVEDFPHPSLSDNKEPILWIRK